MGTNFYWTKIQPWFLENAKNIVLDLKEDYESPVIHIGKRSAAGLYCTKCGCTINRYGTQSIHSEVPDIRILSDPHLTKKQKEREQEIADGFNNIFFAISDNMSKGLKATSKENTELAKKLHKHICEYSFDCSADVFSSIGYGYVKNPEFKNNMDKFFLQSVAYLFLCTVDIKTLL